MFEIVQFSISSYQPVIDVSNPIYSTNITLKYGSLMERNNGGFPSTTNQSLPPIMKINFDKAISGDKILVQRNQENQSKLHNVKRAFLLKKQMSETRLQEYKRQQYEHKGIQKSDDDPDSFLSPEKLSKSKQKLFIMNDEGKMQKRSILGTPDIFKQAQNKLKESQKAKKQQTQTTNGSQNQGILKSTISTPQGRRLRNHKISSMETNSSNSQQKGVNFSNKPNAQQEKIVSDQYIDRMFSDLNEKIKENEIEEQQQLEQLPQNIKLQQSKSQRIFQRYEQAKDFWEKKKNQLAIKSHKQATENSLMHQTFEFRKKIETQELVDKARVGIDTLGSTLWRANLRNYHINNINLRLQGTYQKPKNKTEEQVRNLALREQNQLEKEEAKKTFLYLDSIGQSNDMASVYLDKSCKPTEIIRVPNLDQSRRNIGDATGSYFMDRFGETHQFNQTIKSNDNGYQDGYVSQTQWINENFKQAVIKEENEDDHPMYQTTDSLKSLINIRELGDKNPRFLTSKKYSLKISDLDAQSTQKIDQRNLIGSRYSYNQSVVSHLSRKKLQALDQMEKTTELIRGQYSHLISPTTEEDVMNLYLIGTNKLQSEYAAAKRISGQKVLYDKNRLENENDDQNYHSDKEEILAINYEQKLFY